MPADGLDSDSGFYCFAGKKGTLKFLSCDTWSWCTSSLAQGLGKLGMKKWVLSGCGECRVGAGGGCAWSTQCCGNPLLTLEFASRVATFWVFLKLKDARTVEPEMTVWSSFLLSAMSRLHSERKSTEAHTL